MYFLYGSQKTKMKSPLPSFELLQLINLKHLPKDKRLPRNVIKLIGKYIRITYRFYSDIFDIRDHRYLRFQTHTDSDFSKDMTEYMIILVNDLIPEVATYKETAGNATDREKRFALYRTIECFEELPLRILKHPDKPNHCEWMLLKYGYNHFAKEDRHSSGVFKAFKCPQTQQHQWDAATKQLANQIIQEVFAWELREILKNKADTIV